MIKLLGESEMEMKAKTARVILATTLAMGAAGITTHAMAASSKAKCPVEACYGIAKKGKNDCGTAKHACAAESVKDGQRSEWMFVMKGTCQNIVGGSLTAPGKTLKQSEAMQKG